MIEGWQKQRSRSRSKKKKDKDKKKKHKHERSRSRSHHKKKKKYSSPEKKQKLISPQNNTEKRHQPEKQRQKSQQKSVDRQSLKQKSEKKRRRDSRSDSLKKKKKKKDWRERRETSYSYQRNRNKKKKKDQKSDKYYRKDDYRRDKKKRSSDRRYPSSSPQSQVKEDPEQLQKLSQLKAAKELVSSKADRKLYLGNLPPNITSQQLMDMLNSALKKMEINTESEGDSIVSAWISPDGVGHYAFVEFRTAQEATNGLTLNGASLYGYQLKLGRPKQYIEYNKALLSDMGTDKNLQTILKKVVSFGKQQLPLIEQKIISPPTKIIVLKHIVSIEELGIDQEYQQIILDVEDMAKRFGNVQHIIIPRPHTVIDLQSIQKRVQGLGLIFIEYSSTNQAIFARKQFIQKQFSGRPVACSFFDQNKFREGEYNMNNKVIIDF